MIITTRLNRDFELLKQQAVAVEASVTEPAGGLMVPALDTDLTYLRWTTYVAVGGGFVILYVGLVSIVWRGWRTIKSQETALLDAYSELRSAYQEVRDAQEKQVRSERLAAIGELAAGVAHDLRNPLGAIKNAAYYITGKLKNSGIAASNPKISEFLEIVDEEVESSNQILTDLMDFARVNPPNKSPTELEALVDSVLSRTPIKGSVRVDKRFDQELPRVLADGDQLRRALSNLFKNADDAMPDGGAITVTGAATDSSVELKISDTGNGISDKDLPKVMDPLFTNKAKGIGLGLAIVNMIVEEHSGTIVGCQHKWDRKLMETLS